MKNSNKILSIAVILLLLANIAMVIYIVKCRNHSDAKPSDKKSLFEAMDKELNMTEQQKTEVKKFRDAHFAVSHPLSDSLRAAKEAFFGLLKEPQLNDSIFNVYSKRIIEIQDTIDKLSFAHLQRVRNVFDSTQKNKYDEFIRKMVQRGKKDSTGKKK
jgi:hypothetical protein